MHSGIRARRGGRLIAVAVVAVLAVGSLSALQDTAGAEPPPAWNLLSNPIPTSSGNSGLSDVSCVTSAWCMAVGHNYGQPLIEHWDGTSWMVVVQPDVVPSGQLKSVVCTSPSWCMAVGAAGAGTLAELRDGGQWSVLNSPSPGTTSSALVRLSCADETYCMAIGTQSTPAAPLAETWDGSGWTIAPSPPPDATGTDSVFGVSCRTALTCMVVGTDATSSTTGRPYSAVWNGSQWSRVQVPSLGTDDKFFGVSCASPTTCVAVGSSNGGIDPAYTIPLFEGWDGAQWTVQADSTNYARYDDFQFDAVDCTSPTYCAAVGTAGLPGNFYRSPLFSEFNGSGWLGQGPGTDDQVRVDGVSCTAPQTCVAVGQDTESTGFVHPLVASDYQYVGGQYEGYPTGLGVSSSANPAPSGVPVTFTAHLTAFSFENETVTFFADSFAAPIPGCASVPVTANDQVGQASATCTTTSLLQGTHNIYAVNSGGGYHFAGSASLTNGETITNGVVITTTSLPDAPLYKYYSTTLKATGGKSPLTWTLVSGTLPTGLHLSASGVISGTPTRQDGQTFIIKVSDSAKPQAYEQLPFGIDVTPLTFTSLQLSEPVAKSFSVQLKATGGKGTLVWYVTAGSLPPGVKLSSSGVMSGTITATGFYGVGVGVHDSLAPNPQYAGGGVFITVDPIAISPTTLANATAGKYYTTTFKAIGGKPTLKWTVSSGSLPSGLKLSTSGWLTGTPKAAGSYTFTVTVTDANSPANTSSETLTLTVN
jgi:hypothetical protein